jgi:hypothetical protein
MFSDEGNDGENEKEVEETETDGKNIAVAAEVKVVICLLPKHVHQSLCSHDQPMNILLYEIRSPP